jgi:phospholipid/cholesterol/gamma-HCH transport system substrate-binding protein
MRFGRRTRLVARTALAAALAAGAASYLVWGRSGPPSITVRAHFSDVAGLVPGAPVELADITIGHVASISLDGDGALVVLSVERSADVPADVSAEIRQATILGQQIVELVPGGGPAASGLLADGTTIRNASLVPGLEQVVQASTAVIGSIGTSDLADLVQAGAQGFGGQGATLRRLLADIEGLSAAYASRDGEITRLVADMNQLGGSLAPHAGADAAAFGDLAQATTVLAQQTDRFDTLIGALDRLSVTGRGILETYLPALNLQLLGLDKVTQALAARQSDLVTLLEYLPAHDAVLSGVTRDKFAQVVNSLIICGLPGGGASPQASETCGPSTGGGS